MEHVIATRQILTEAVAMAPEVVIVADQILGPLDQVHQEVDLVVILHRDLRQTLLTRLVGVQDQVAGVVIHHRDLRHHLLLEAVARNQVAPLRGRKTKE